MGTLAAWFFKVSATGFNPLWDMALGRENGTCYGPRTYIDTDLHHKPAQNLYSTIYLQLQYNENKF
jgi:hypothetical protein